MESLFAYRYNGQFICFFKSREDAFKRLSSFSVELGLNSFDIDVVSLDFGSPYFDVLDC